MKSRRVTRLRYQLECWILLRNVPIFGSTGKAKKPGYSRFQISGPRHFRS